MEEPKAAEGIDGSKGPTGATGVSGATFVPSWKKDRRAVAFVPSFSPRKASASVGPNAPCPCGKLREDGKPVKYKKCCGGNG